LLWSAGRNINENDKEQSDYEIEEENIEMGRILEEKKMKERF
jgi:hypothetical protein